MLRNDIRRALPFSGLPLFFEGPDQTAVITELKKQLDDSNKLLKGLAALVQQQGAAITSINTNLTTLSKSHTQPNGDDDDDDDGEVDFDGMKQGDFAKFMIKEVGKLLDQRLTDVDGKVKGVVTEFRNDKIRDQFVKLSSDIKDFRDWGEEISALSKIHPSLNLKQLYTLARDGDPDKAKQMDEKYAEKKEEPKGEMSLFGGFRPTIGKASGDGDGKEAKKMTADEAMNASWNAIMTEFPALAKLNEEANID